VAFERCGTSNDARRKKLGMSNESSIDVGNGADTGFATDGFRSAAGAPANL
jgi:hypothetical protein